MRQSDEWFGRYLTPPASAAFPATRPETINRPICSPITRSVTFPPS